jgi:hypothetical protein
VTNQLTKEVEVKKENFGIEVDIVKMKGEQVVPVKGQLLEVVYISGIVAAVRTVKKKVMMGHIKMGEVMWGLKEVARVHLS